MIRSHRVAYNTFIAGVLLTTILVGILNIRMWISMKEDRSLVLQQMYFTYSFRKGTFNSNTEYIETMNFNKVQGEAKPSTFPQPLKAQNSHTHVVAPTSKQSDCLKEHCTNYLKKSELLAMDRCLQETYRRIKTENKSSVRMAVRDNDCRFIDGSKRRPVALVSTEGSGNTWIRGLLEKATGICTGFLYCDSEMRQAGSIGEGVKSGSVLVVKTHTKTTHWYGVKYSERKQNEPFYGSAIFILRNPYDSIIAEWNRRITNNVMKKNHLPHSDSHTNVVPELKYWRKLFQNNGSLCKIKALVCFRWAGVG